MNNVKAFLQQARNIDRRIDWDEEQLQRLRARLEAGRMSAMTGMPRGGASDWTDTAARLIKLERRINERIRDMCRVKHQVMDAIDTVEDARCRDLLTLYYLNGMTWQQVADAMGIKDIRWLYRLHGRALLRVAIPPESEKK